VLFFLVRMGCGVQLDLLGTAATNRPIMLTPGDYDDEVCGLMIGRGNRSILGGNVVDHKPHTLPGREPGRCGGKPSTNRLSYGTAILWLLCLYMYPLPLYVLQR
jgi:hypothetical protein